MKTKSIITIVMCVALAACMTVAYAPVAYAATSSAKTLTVSTVSTQTATKTKTPKPKKVSSVKITSKKAGAATVSWKASKVKGLTNQTYTVRWAYNKAMKNAKTKTVKTKKLNLSSLKEGKKLYVQVRTNAKYGKKTLHSKWSAKKTVKIAKTRMIKGIPAEEFVPDVWPSIVGNINKSSAKNINAVRVQCHSYAHWTEGNGYFLVRYSYNKSMKDAAYKALSCVDQYPTGNLTLKNLKKGKTLYVQVRNCCVINASYNRDWSDIKSIKIPSKWIKEKGHWEPVYTTVVDQDAYTTYTVVNYVSSPGQETWSTTDRDAARQRHIQYGGNSWAENIPEYHPAVTHQEQTGKRWVVDVPGHWV